MNSHYTYLSGFESFRTPDSIAALLTESNRPPRPKRYCSRCGAVLRQSNPGPLCAPCSPPVAIPEWMETIAAIDGRPTTIDSLAALLTGQNRVAQVRQRNAAMREEFESGRKTQAELTVTSGLSWQQVHAILNREPDPERMHRRDA